MDKVGRPRGLIAYDTLHNLEAAGKDTVPIKLLRPRVVLYATAILIVGLVMLTALMLRPELDVNILRDRNPVYVKLSDGGVRNGYTVKLLNKLYEPRSFSIGVAGLPGAKLSVIGHEDEKTPVVEVPPDNLQAIRLYVTLDKAALTALGVPVADFSFVVTDRESGASTAHEATFRGPGE